jgi:hypothetical protein
MPRPNPLVNDNRVTLTSWPDVAYALTQGVRVTEMQRRARERRRYNRRRKWRKFLPHRLRVHLARFSPTETVESNLPT